MALSEIHFWSPILMKHVAATVLLPDKGKPPFATMYLLHGLSDDHTIWQRRTRIEEYVNHLPLAIVMPDGYRGFYTNHDNGPAYADYIIKDVIGTMERHFNLRTDRAGRCIGGLSMGGYGALRLALGYPDLFVSAHSHSGALTKGSMKLQPVTPEWLPVFGEDPTGTDHDIFVLAKRAKQKKKLPKLLIDCGVDDFLIEWNRRTNKEFTKMKIPHEYNEYPGVHSWEYWDIHIREAIAFHAKHLKLKEMK